MADGLELGVMLADTIDGGKSMGEYEAAVAAREETRVQRDEGGGGYGCCRPRSRSFSLND